MQPEWSAFITYVRHSARTADSRHARRSFGSGGKQSARSAIIHHGRQAVGTLGDHSGRPSFAQDGMYSGRRAVRPYCRHKQGGQTCFKKHSKQKNTGISAPGPGQGKDGKEVYEKARAITGPKRGKNAPFDGTT